MKLALVALAFVACGPSAPAAQPEVPGPNTVVHANSSDITACAHLAVLGCPEAFPNPQRCVDLFTQARTYAVPIPNCFSLAADVAAVRLCGNSGTLTFECK